MRVIKRLLSYIPLVSILALVVTPASAAISGMAAQSQNSTIMIVATPDYVYQPPAPEPTTTVPVITTSVPPSTTVPPTTSTTPPPVTTTTAPPTTIITASPPTTTTALPPVTSTTAPPTTTPKPPPATTAPPSTGEPDDNPVLKIDTNGQITAGGVNKIDLKTESSISSAAEYVQVMTLVVESGTNAWKKDGSRLETIDFKEVTVTALPPLPKGVRPLSAVVELGPEGSYFTKSMELTLSYDPEAAKGFDQSALYIACYDGNSVFPLYCTVDTVNHTVTATLSRISSVYTVLPCAPARPFNWWWLLLLLPLLLLALVRRPRITFLTRPQALMAGEISGLITVQLRDRLGRAQKVRDEIMLVLESSSPAGRFDQHRDGAFDVTFRTISVPPRSSSASFYYRDRTSEGPVITVRHKPETGARERWHPAQQKQHIGHPADWPDLETGN